MISKTGASFLIVSRNIRFLFPVGVTSASAVPSLGLAEQILSMKNAVFWDVAPCRSCVNRRFGGTHRPHSG
jgi:hypothetical protein